MEVRFSAVNFSLQGPDRLSSPSRYISDDCWSSFLGLKRPRRESDQSSYPSAEIKNAWSYTFTPSYVFFTWGLIKHRTTFTSEIRTETITEESASILPKTIPI